MVFKSKLRVFLSRRCIAWLEVFWWVRKTKMKYFNTHFLTGRVHSEWHHNFCCWEVPEQMSNKVLIGSFLSFSATNRWSCLYNAWPRQKINPQKVAHTKFRQSATTHYHWVCYCFVSTHNLLGAINQSHIALTGNLIMAYFRLYWSNYLPPPVTGLLSQQTNKKQCMLEKIDVTLKLFYPDAENMGKSSCRQVFCLDDGQQFSVHRAMFVFEKQNKKMCGTSGNHGPEISHDFLLRQCLFWIFCLYIKTAAETVTIVAMQCIYHCFFVSFTTTLCVPFCALCVRLT